MICCAAHIARTNADALLEELQWASARPESRWSENGNDTVPNAEDLDSTESWEACLTTWEHTAYTKYLAQCPEGLFSLNQNPDRRATFSKPGNVTWKNTLYMCLRIPGQVIVGW